MTADALTLLLVCDSGQQESAAAAAQWRADGHAVTQCGGSEAALVALRSQSFDAVLCPIELAGPAPDNLLHAALALQPDLWVIVLAQAGSSQPARMAALAAGASEVVAAPLSQAVARAVLVPAQRVHRLRADQARLAQAAQEAGQRVEALQQAFERFAGRISHDLQGVLQNIEGFATALQHTGAAKLDEAERRYLQKVVDTSLRGNHLVHELLGFARLAVQPVVWAAVPLEPLFQRARRALEAHHQGRRVVWDFGPLPAVWGDCALLQVACTHLLGNALRYTRGQPCARIRVQAVPLASGLEIQVEDNGVALAPDQFERVFEPFHRRHPAPEFDGDGMDLAAVKQVIERLGGQIRVANAPEGGALLAFRLPAPPPTIEARMPQVAAATADPGAGTLRVLLVDDDPMVLLSVRTMLELDGHQVAAAAGGQVGINALRQSLDGAGRFDVVITDLGMPHVDGHEVAHAVKTASPSTQVILLTGAGMPTHGPGQLPPDVDAVLGKPPRLAQLRQVLAAARTALQNEPP